MSPKTIVEATLALPAISGMAEWADDTDQQAKEKRARKLIDPCLNRILTYGEWEFATERAEEDTVADQAAYTLTGNDNDCRNILSIRYDTSERHLIPRSRKWMDNQLSRYTYSDVYFWVPDGIVDGHPRVILVDTPGTSGKTILYRYRAKGITINDIPDEYDWVMIDVLAAALNPALEAKARRSLRKMHATESPRVGPDPALLDPRIIDANNDRSLLDGTWGT